MSRWTVGQRSKIQKIGPPEPCQLIRNLSFFIEIDNKTQKWNLRVSSDRIKCKPTSVNSTTTKDTKKLKVYEICRNNVKENGKSRPNCDYRNDDIWDKTYIGRMEILMPTTGTDTKGKTVQKKKYLYFQMN